MARRDFGSFMASNVQELIEQPDASYIAPNFPSDMRLPTFKSYHNEPFQFGAAARRKHFLLEDHCTFINHGAFGAVLKDALDVAQQWQIYTEKQPLRFFDRELLPHMVFVTRRLSKFIGCDPRNLLLMENVTTAINTVLRNIKLKEGDVIFCFNITYGAVKKILKHVCDTTGAVIQEESIKFPIENIEHILDILEKTLKEDTKLAVFDHIPSNTPFVLPLKKIISICHKKNIPVLVDGAHALGNLDLKMEDLNPDYYVSNAHKWFCSPKGCAFMYVKSEHRQDVRPLIISHGYGSGFNSEFIWTGLHDYSPFLSLHTVIDFWTTIGADNIRQYSKDLLREAASMLEEEWKSGGIVPLEMTSMMTLVELPCSLWQSVSEPLEYSHAECVQNALHKQYNIEVPVKCVQGKLYVRISAHIYNELVEYMKLKTAVLELCEIDIFKCMESNL